MTSHKLASLIASFSLHDDWPCARNRELNLFLVQAQPSLSTLEESFLSIDFEKLMEIDFRFRLDQIYRRPSLTKVIVTLQTSTTWLSALIASETLIIIRWKFMSIFSWLTTDSSRSWLRVCCVSSMLSSNLENYLVGKDECQTSIVWLRFEVNWSESVGIPCSALHLLLCFRELLECFLS